jgi:hypothetical protein
MTDNVDAEGKDGETEDKEETEDEGMSLLCVSESFGKG